MGPGIQNLRPGIKIYIARTFKNCAAQALIRGLCGLAMHSKYAEPTHSPSPGVRIAIHLCALYIPALGACMLFVISLACTQSSLNSCTFAFMAGLLPRPLAPSSSHIPTCVDVCFIHSHRPCSLAHTLFSSSLTCAQHGCMPHPLISWTR